jgi:hypothetical protein
MQILLIINNKEKSLDKIENIGHRIMIFVRINFIKMVGQSKIFLYKITFDNAFSYIFIEFRSNLN